MATWPLCTGDVQALRTLIDGPPSRGNIAQTEEGGLQSRVLFFTFLNLCKDQGSED